VIAGATSTRRSGGQAVARPTTGMDRSGSIGFRRWQGVQFSGRQGLGLRIGDQQDLSARCLSSIRKIMRFAVAGGALAIYQLGDDVPRIAPGAWVAETPP
jgi:hypothetical protein